MNKSQENFAFWNRKISEILTSWPEKFQEMIALEYSLANEENRFVIVSLLAASVSVNQVREKYKTKKVIREEAK